MERNVSEPNPTSTSGTCEAKNDWGDALVIGNSVGCNGHGVMLRERGLVEVKGSPKPIRMFLAERM